MFSVRALRPGPAAGRAACGQAAAGEETAGGQRDMLPVLPDPVARDAERALARFWLLGEGAAELSQSLAGQLRGLFPQLRQVVEGRRVTV